MYDVLHATRVDSLVYNYIYIQLGMLYACTTYSLRIHICTYKCISHMCICVEIGTSHILFYNVIRAMFNNRIVGMYNSVCVL